MNGNVLRPFRAWIIISFIYFIGLHPMLLYTALSELPLFSYLSDVFYCKTDRRENPFDAPYRLLSIRADTGAAKDWNDSGGQRPAIIQVKSKKYKVMRQEKYKLADVLISAH